MNCKVIKKWQPPHFYINLPPFQVYPSFLAKTFEPLPKWLNFWEVLPPPSPPLIRGRGGPTMPTDPHINCRIILWLFFTKYNIQKFNLLSKTDISKTAWINPWCCFAFLEQVACQYWLYHFFLFLLASILEKVIAKTKWFSHKNWYWLNFDLWFTVHGKSAYFFKFLYFVSVE